MLRQVLSLFLVCLCTCSADAGSKAPTQKLMMRSGAPINRFSAPPPQRGWVRHDVTIRDDGAIIVAVDIVNGLGKVVDRMTLTFPKDGSPVTDDEGKVVWGGRAAVVKQSKALTDALDEAIGGAARDGKFNR